MQLQDFSAVIQKLKTQLEADPDNIELLLKLSECYLKTEGDKYFNSVIHLDRILELDPDNFPANRIRGLIYKEQDNPEKALECFTRLLEQYSHAADHPEYIDIRFDYAEILEELDRIDEALAIFEELSKKQPKHLPFLFKLAHIYEIQERYDDAVSMYNHIMGIDPENEAALAQLVDLYESTDKKQYHLKCAELAMKEGNLGKSLSELKKVIPYTVEPQEECDIHKRLAAIYVLQTDYNHALDEYKAAMDLVEDDYEIYKGIGKIYFETEEYEEALELFERALKLNDQDYSIHIEMADCFIEQEKFPEAIRELETVKAHIPDDLDIRSSLAEGYICVRDFYRAQQEIDFILARDPNNTRAIGSLVDLNIDKEDYNKALEVSQQLVKIIPNSPYSSRKMAECYKALGDEYNAHYNFGLAYELQGEQAMAIDEYEYALELKQDSSELLMKIGELYINMGEKFIGIEYFERAAELEDNNLLPLKKLSEFYINNDDIDRAAEVLARIVEIDKRDSDSMYNLAVILEKQKYYEDSLEAYNKFIELVPNSNKADQVNKKIASLRKKLRLDVGNDTEDSDEYEEDKTIIQKIMGLFGR